MLTPSRPRPEADSAPWVSLTVAAGASVADVGGSRATAVAWSGRAAVEAKVRRAATRDPRAAL